jgi:predicted DNA binding protein
MAVRNPDADRPERYTVYTDITERKERERELERTRELLEQAQRVAGVGGWELDVRADPPELTWSEEVYRIHDLPTGETVEFDEGVGFYHPDDRPRVQERVERALEEGEPYDIEARLVTAEGDQRWVQSIAEPVTEDGEVVALRGSVQDITEQKERELALKSLHEVTCGLLETETDAGAAELVVDAAAEALGLECVGVYLFDSTSNRLEPVAHVDALGGLFEEMGAVETGADSPVWDCFVSGERAVLDGTGEGWRELTCESAVGGLLVPMGDHGVFVAATRDPALEAETRRLVETLVATAEAAFDRIETETSLRERDAELEAQNRRLRRQIQINDIIRQVDRSLVEAGSRAEIERTVCDRMVAADDIALAWIGSLDAAGNRLGIRQWVGSGEAYLDRVELATDAGDEPAVETVLSGEPTAVRNVLSDPDRSGWRGEALGAGLHSVLSVPLAFEEVTYGVLTVYSSEPEAFGDLERSVFAELGENIANSINAVETRQALHADTLVELTLELGADEDFLGRIARAAGCTVTYEGSATHTDEGARLFFRTADARPETVERVLEDLVVVDEYQLVAADFDAPEVGNAALFEATVTGSVLASRLVRHGGRPRSMTATPGGTDVVVAVPPSVEVREFVEMLRTSFPSVELVGRRTIERSTHTRQELVQSLLESLTDRQREVLQTAYHAGFFEWPRASTGEEVAAMLGVTQPTVNRHIRLAQQRLFAHLFEEGDVVLPDETV